MSLRSAMLRPSSSSTPGKRSVLVYMNFPRGHWPQIASTTPLERINREIKRSAGVVGIFPNGDAMVRLAGALMRETNDEWAVARRCMSLETLARATTARSRRRAARRGRLNRHRQLSEGRRSDATVRDTTTRGDPGAGSSPRDAMG